MGMAIIVPTNMIMEIMPRMIRVSSDTAVMRLEYERWNVLSKESIGVWSEIPCFGN